MATSGSKSVTVTSWNTLKFSWEETSQSIANNTTTISWKMELIATSSGRLSSTASKDWKVTVNGVNYSGTNSIAISNNSTKTLASGTTTIKHNSDGKKSFSYSFSQEFAITFSGSALGTKSGSGTGTLDTIPRQAKVTAAPNFNDEANPKITYNNPAGSAASTLQAAIYGSDATTVYAAYRDISKTGTSYTFNLTTEERNKLRNAIPNSKSMTVRFYVKTVIGGNTYYSHLSKTFSITNGLPTISPSVIDSNSVTTGLTGDNNILVKYFSNAAITFNAGAVKGATVKSRKVVNGNKSLTADGTISKVESGSFKFTVTDSRGYSTSKTITKSMVNYVKLTCGYGKSNFNTDGVITFAIKGNYFNSTFGAVANTLAVKYRYKEQGGTYGDWVTVTPTLSNNTYSANVTITGLDYQKKYVIQAQAADKLTTISSSEKTMSCVPLFDMGEADFNFNCDVSMANNYKIMGTTTTGEKINCLQPLNQNNNCVLGYGGYDNEIGATNLYGNDINLFTKTDCTINSSYSILGAIKAMTNSYSLDTTTTPGSGWTVNAANATLCGNTLRVHINATRGTETGVGNVTNETVVTLKIKHDGKIKGMLNVSFPSGATGGMCAFNTDDSSVDDTYITFDVSLVATAQAITQTTSYFVIPVTIDTTKY